MLPKVYQLNVLHYTVLIFAIFLAFLNPSICSQVVEDHNYWLIHCNAYKCECPLYQHRCPESPWCVNDWDTCDEGQDSCPVSRGNCQHCKYLVAIMI